MLYVVDIEHGGGIEGWSRSQRNERDELDAERWPAARHDAALEGRGSGMTRDEAPLSKTLDLLMHVRDEADIHTGSSIVNLASAGLDTGRVPPDEHVERWRGCREVVSRWILDHEDSCPRESAEAIATVLTGAILGTQVQWLIEPDAVDIRRTLGLLARMASNEIAATTAGEGPVET